MNADLKTIFDTAVRLINRLLTFGISWFLLTLLFTYVGVHLWSLFFVPEGEYISEFTPANIGVVAAVGLAPLGSTLVILALRRTLDRYPTGSLLALTLGGGFLVFAIWRFLLNQPLPT